MSIPLSLQVSSRSDLFTSWLPLFSCSNRTDLGPTGIGGTFSAARVRGPLRTLKECHDASQRYWLHAYACCQLLRPYRVYDYMQFDHVRGASFSGSSRRRGNFVNLLCSSRSIDGPACAWLARVWRMHGRLREMSGRGTRVADIGQRTQTQTSSGQVSFGAPLARWVAGRRLYQGCTRRS